MSTSRRRFLGLSAGLAGAAALGLPPSIARALTLPANRRTGTIRDVEHIIVFMQENRSFDHYFGSLRGVRGFGDRFPIPVPDAPGLERKTVWFQRNEMARPGETAILAPQHNDTGRDFALLRTASTPHLYPDAQSVWDGGRMTSWPRWKRSTSAASARAPSPR